MRIINIKGILPKSHGCRLKSHRFQRPDSFRFPLCFFIKKCPWYLEYGSHADTDRTAVQWIAAPRCQQHRIHPKSRRRTKDRAYISRIYHIFQNCDPAGIFAYIDYIRKRRPAHCTEHSSCQLESSQLRQHIKFCRINRDVSTTTDQFFCLTLNMFMFHQKRNRLAPGIQSSLNNLRALRNKDPLLRFCPVQKLYLRDPGIYIQLRSVEICDFYDI